VSTHKTLLVDADYLLYRIGFAVKDDEPVEYALATARASVHNIQEKFPDSDKTLLFLTGKGNFRDKVATHQIYKGNRDPANKPRLYDEIKEYLIKHQGAEIVTGMEAEDECGIRQYEAKDKSTVIVGVDKDLMCIPGWHYNPVKDLMVYQTLPEADAHFWLQVLMGDRVDNIRGIDKIGPKTAAKIIAACEGNIMTMREKALELYVKQHGNDGEAILDETAKLVWILRKRGETYDGSSI
jgi:5'-3' exonuclease